MGLSRGIRRRIYPKLALPNPQAQGVVTVTVEDAGGTGRVWACAMGDEGRGLSASAWPRAIPTAKTSARTTSQATRLPVELFLRRGADEATGGGRGGRGGGGRGG